eukprot:364492-Chlamydomonas_euryale.AAC.3
MPFTLSHRRHTPRTCAAGCFPDRSRVQEARLLRQEMHTALEGGAGANDAAVHMAHHQHHDHHDNEDIDDDDEESDDGDGDDDDGDEIMDGEDGEDEGEDAVDAELDALEGASNEGDHGGGAGRDGMALELPGGQVIQVIPIGDDGAHG